MTTVLGGGVVTNQGMYGDGSDGVVTISVDTTLIKDMYYSQLTVNSGINLITSGYKVFCSEFANIVGNIHNNGGNGGNGGSGGAGGPKGTTGGSNVGNGGDTVSAGAGVPQSISPGLGGDGGQGGGFDFGGDSGATTVLLSDTGGGIRLYKNLIAALRVLTWQGQTLGGGSGGGGGEEDGLTGIGGGGGGGGGICYIIAKEILGSGEVQAKGGNGGDASSADAGGGGGGGGGIVIIISNNNHTLTLNVNGGTGGVTDAPSGSPVDGVAGGIGKTFKLINT